MPNHPPDGPPPSLYMRLDEVAHELGYKSRDPIYRLIYDGQLAAVPVGPGKSLRVSREEFRRYCQAREAEGRVRFGAGAA